MKDGVVHDVLDGQKKRGASNKAMDYLKRQANNFFSKKTLHKRVPITKWLPNYNLEMLEGDVLAGFTVGLTVIPQGIAYAIVAGLPPNYGLYSAFMGCYIYIFFGGCTEISIGPTAIMAIMTHEYSGHGGPDYAVLLCFLSGLIIFAAGICNLGFLINFISKPVIVGFTSAAAITIATSQLKGLFGLSFSSEGFIDTWSKLVHNISDTRWQDVILGFTCMAALLLMRKMKDLKVLKPSENDSTGIKILKKCVFLSSVGRNAIIVIIAAIIAFALNNNQPFKITGEVTPGLPDFKVPPFSTVVGNTTYNFSDIMSDVGAGIIVIPLISILESIAIASAFSGGKSIDATQEMLALGLCNVVGSFVQSMPVTGSFSRTAVNASSGVKSPAGGLVTGTLVVLALAFLTPYFKFIPKATLSAVIICAVIFMVEYEMVLPIWRARRLDQIPLWGSFLTCLFWKLEYGILVGVALNLALLLYGIARPKIKVEAVAKENGDDLLYVLVQPRSGLYFPSTDYIQGAVSRAGIKTGKGYATVALDCCHFTGVDYSAAKCVKALCKDFEKRQQVLVLKNVSPGVKAGLSSLTENLKIATTEEEFNDFVRNVYPMSSADGATSSNRNNPVTRRNGQDPEVTNPLLSPTGTKPIIVKQSA